MNKLIMSGLLVFIVGTGLLFGTSKIREGFYINSINNNTVKSWLACYDLTQLMPMANLGITDFRSPFRQTKHASFSTIINNNKSKGLPLDDQFTQSDIEAMKQDIKAWGVLDSYNPTALNQVRDLWLILSSIWVQNSTGKTLTPSQKSFQGLMNGTNPIKHINDIALKSGKSAVGLYKAEILQMRRDIQAWGVLVPLAMPPSITTPQAVPTQAAPTQAVPTQAAPTQATPTQVVPTQVVPTQVVPTQAAPTQAAPTQAGSVAYPMDANRSAPTVIIQLPPTTSNAWPGPEPNRDVNDLKWKSKNKSWKRSSDDSEMEPYSCDHDMNDYIKKDEIPCWNCSL